MKLELRPPDPPPLSQDRQRQRVEQVLKGYSQLRPVQRRRWRVVVAVVVPALLLVGSLSVAAYARFQSGPARTLTGGVGCFEKASLTADVAVVDLKGLSPLDRCREVWESSGLPRDRVDRLLRKVFGRGKAAPSLIACVNPTGAIAVFPGRDPGECGRLGLREPAPGELLRLQRFDAFKQAVIQGYFVNSDCVNPITARRGIQRLLKRHGLVGWRVKFLDEVQPDAKQFDEARPCALLDLRLQDRLVVLYPDARPPLSQP